MAQQASVLPNRRDRKARLKKAPGSKDPLPRRTEACKDPPGPNTLSVHVLVHIFCDDTLAALCGARTGATIQAAFMEMVDQQSICSTCLSKLTNGAAAESLTADSGLIAVTVPRDQASWSDLTLWPLIAGVRSQRTSFKYPKEKESKFRNESHVALCVRRSR